MIEDMIRGKKIKMHIHNLRPFVFDPHHVNPIDVT